MKGQIEGNIVDLKNSRMPDVIVIAADSVTNISDTVWSDKRGFYFFKRLKPGKYKLVAKTPGYDPNVSKYILVSAPPAKSDEGDDTYYAIRYDITLVPAKVPD